MIVELGLLLVTLVLAVVYYNSLFKFWDRFNIAVYRPKTIFFGNDFQAIFSVKSLKDIHVDLYNQFPNERFVGNYSVTTPELFLRDPKLIESVMTSDFAFACNRGNAIDTRATKVSMHLVNTNDDHWRSLRQKLTPTFTSGKLKGMHSQLLECADELVHYLDALGTGKPFEAREVVSGYTMDVIASCAFGLNLGTVKDPNSLFRTLGKANFTFTTKRKVMTVVRRLSGPFGKYVKVPGSLTPEMINFFINAVDNTIEYRKKNGISRPDFLHLMNELREKDQEMVKTGKLDSNDPYIFDHTTLVSNAFVFFVAGYETTATAISYVMYNLALNESVQNKLYNEIVEVMKKHGGELTYDSFKDMDYMEMVLLETLRLTPPVPTLRRVVTKEYRVPGSDVVMPVGSYICIPICALHQDPELYPEPDRFLPERFADEKEQTFAKGIYLPFGMGPRICIGARFAKIELKVAVAKMMLKYEFLKCNETEIPLTFDKRAFMTIPDKGIWLQLAPRKTTS